MPARGTSQGLSQDDGYVSEFSLTQQNFPYHTLEIAKTTVNFGVFDFSVQEKNPGFVFSFALHHCGLNAFSSCNVHRGISWRNQYSNVRENDIK